MKRRVMLMRMMRMRSLNGAVMRSSAMLLTRFFGEDDAVVVHGVLWWGLMSTLMDHNHRPHFD